MTKTLKRIIPALLTVVVSTLLGACNTSGCTDNQNSLPLAGFYSYRTLGAITVDSLDIGGIGAPGDSLLYQAGTPLTEAYLPFRSRETETAFFIEYRQSALRGLRDTISFTYTSEPYFAGEECGAMLRYRIWRMTYTKNLIDSVGIVDSLITNLPVQQIHIYFPTAEEE